MKDDDDDFLNSIDFEKADSFRRIRYEETGNFKHESGRMFMDPPPPQPKPKVKREIRDWWDTDKDRDRE